MTCPHTGYVECDDDYRDADLPWTAAGRADMARAEREHPDDIYCQHDHGTCDPSQPLGRTTECRCTGCGRPFCENHVMLDKYGEHWCAQCVGGLLAAGEFEPSVVTDAMLRERHGQRRLFPRTEKEAELEQAIRDWKEGRDG